jgi:enoyl-CoA hydratase/carnithine racemase
LDRSILTLAAPQLRSDLGFSLRWAGMLAGLPGVALAPTIFPAPEPLRGDRRGNFITDYFKERNLSKFAEYQNRFEFVRLRREDGILEITIHKNGGPAKWGSWEGAIHDELGQAFYEVSHDRENRIVIFTGAGDTFLQEFDFDGSAPPTALTPAFWDRIYKEGKDLINNLLDIEVPVIGAVNGNAFIHSELLVLSDIVLAAEHARFADKAHFPGGTVPGDGVHIVWSALIGPNRSRYFLLTGEEIDAHEARRLSVVAEVLPAASLNQRAWALARELATKSDLALRYTRATFTLDLKRRMTNDLSHGLLLEGLAVMTPAK